MCGRYYVDPDTENEIRKVIEVVENKLNMSQGDVFPTQQAVVLTGSGHGIHAEKMIWGMPRYNKSGLVINARAETVFEKQLFRDTMGSRRCIIPAAGFYEWNRQKEKFRFWRDGQPVLYLAGCYDLENRFVILTTDANSSVSKIHDRMPVILEPDELQVWFGRTFDYVRLLHKAQPFLQSGSDYHQLSLF